MLRLDQIRYSTGGRDLLKTMSLEFKAGQLSAIIGPNGAGKSTLLKLACDELKPSQGQVLWQGRRFDEYDLADLALERSVLEQHNPLDFHFNAAEVVALGRIPHASGAACDQQIVEDCLALLDVSHLAQSYYPSLSGGEKQRVQIARVLAQLASPKEQNLSPDQAKLLILDEPLTALDLLHQQQLMRLLKRKAELGYCVIVVLHDINLCAQYADHVVLLDRAEMVCAGQVNEVMQVPRLSEVFGLPFYAYEHPKTKQLLFTC